MGNDDHKKRVTTGWQHLHAVSSILFYLFALLPFFLFLSSCGGNSNMFKLEGHFKNLNGGEFYLYDMNDGWKDTIVIQNGDFTYERVIEDTTTLILLFPNYSELPILARAGVDIDIEGDATHLRDTKVTGDEANEQLTEWREKINDMSQPQAQDEARRFIKENPASPACHYLLRRFFLLSPTPDYAEASKLCSTIIKAQPGNRKLLRLRNMLDSYKDKDIKQLPEFSAVDTKGDTITDKFFTSKVNIIQAWANWSYDSQNIVRLIRQKQKDNPDKIAVVAINLDASPYEGKTFLEHDSIPWPNICDGEMWQSPLVKLFGLSSVCETIIFDKDGKTVARKQAGQELEKEIDNLLK